MYNLCHCCPEPHWESDILNAVGSASLCQNLENVELKHTSVTYVQVCVRVFIF